MPQINNAQYGISLQALICEKYKLKIGDSARLNFIANAKDEFYEELKPVAEKIFHDIHSVPIEYLTYDLLGNKGTHNFLLENNKTLSIKTSISSDKAAPKVIGQAGYAVLNEFFGDIYGSEISDQEDIKKLFFNHIDKILPTFIDYLFISNYNYFIDRRHLGEITLIRDKDITEYSFSRDEFSFTKNLDNWNESTTLKFHNISIAEIQVHRNRTFKFRFIISAIPAWFKTIKENNETIGISGEAAVCDVFNLERPESFIERSSPIIQKELIPIVKEAFKTLPKAIKHSGSDPGKRGKRSKSSFDFILEGGLKLSLKTNIGSMVCPPEVGQPSDVTCTEYFKEFLPDGEICVTRDNFKKMVLEHIEDMIPIYLRHMFDSDWLLWIFKKSDGWHFKSIKQEQIHFRDWDKEKFTFTKPTVSDWNESNTVKYDGVSIGEFQVHTHRNCFKFRFYFDKILSFIGL